MVTNLVDETINHVSSLIRKLSKKLGHFVKHFGIIYNMTLQSQFVDDSERELRECLCQCDWSGPSHEQCTGCVAVPPQCGHALWTNEQPSLHTTQLISAPSSLTSASDSLWCSGTLVALPAWSRAFKSTQWSHHRHAWEKAITRK